jgi:hypothetical protein
MSMMSAQSSPCVAVTEKLRGNRVTVGLVVDQYAAERVTRGRSKGQKQLADVLFLGHGRVFAATSRGRPT